MTAPLPRPPEPPPCPEYNGFARRVLLFGGLLFMFGALAVLIFAKNVASWVAVALALVGGALIPNTNIIALVNSWRAGVSNRS